MKERFAWLGTLALLALWVAVTFVIYLGCAKLNETTGTCDPQTAVDRCEPELGTYQR